MYAWHLAFVKICRSLLNKNRVYANLETIEHWHFNKKWEFWQQSLTIILMYEIISEKRTGLRYIPVSKFSSHFCIIVTKYLDIWRENLSLYTTSEGSAHFFPPNANFSAGSAWQETFITSKWIDSKERATGTGTRHSYRPNLVT